MSDLILRSFERLVGSGYVPPGALRGCTANDVRLIEEHIGAELPAAYREFLRIGGRGLGPFLRGSDVTYDWLPRINLGGPIIAEEVGAQLPDGAFFFFGHQGYWFLYFVLGEGDDPQVYTLSDEDGISTLGDRFSDWLRLTVELNV